MNVISVAFASLWDCDSAWHSAQSNHCLQQGARMETWAFRTCLLPSFSVGVRKERSLDGVPHVVVCEIDLRNEQGSHAYNAWHTPRLKFRPCEIRNNFRDLVICTLSTRRGCDASPKENAKKNPRKIENGGRKRYGSLSEAPANADGKRLMLFRFHHHG